VHADLRLANLLVSGDSLEIIDFDDCGFCWFAFDFAAAISFYELDPMIPELKRAWIAGYRTVADLDRKDEDEMGTFVMLRRIMLTAWLASHADSDPAKELGEGYVKGTATLAGQYLRGTLCA
jgi:Ser/Thr protein kinase RdoA (MazF antagonist)